MALPTKINRLLLIAVLLFLAFMSMIYILHYIKRGEPELGYLSSDVKFGSGAKQYFSVFKDGKKVGYNSLTQLSYPGLKVFTEETVLKIYESGISREVFIQSTTGIDSLTYQPKIIEFRIQSGSHAYLFSGEVKSDSLLISVKKNNESPWLKGYFPVEGMITSLSSLPYILHRMKSDTLSVRIFDPVVFQPYTVLVTRMGKDFQPVGEVKYPSVKYSLDFGKKISFVWLDSDGKPLRYERIYLFGEGIGGFTMEKSLDRNLFMLPVVSSLGKADIDTMKIHPDLEISDPRNLNYLKIELDGIRAANIDVSSSNKEVISVNPVIFGIHRSSLPKKVTLSKKNTAFKDTTLLGISDYIQSKDARMFRMAKSIISSETDTLKMAHLINRWVFTKVRKEPDLTISRSIDILRDMKGGRDEHTKLFTALSRSIGIPTKINTGLVYEGNCFRYHSWPSIYANGVWNSVDSWYGQDEADASHVALVQGDFERIVELLRLATMITIKVLEYR
jgi:hypothetical protein